MRNLWALTMVVGFALGMGMSQAYTDAKVTSLQVMQCTKGDRE